MRVPRCLPAALAAAIGIAAGAAPAAAQSWAPPPPAVADRGPMPVTTDTPEYCVFMLNKVRAMQRAAPMPSPDVRLLIFEGRRMCEHGLVRPGIMRLRMAWRLLAEG